MNALLLRFGRIALVILILYALLLVWLTRGPTEDQVAERLQYTEAAAEKAVELLQNVPVDSWEDSFYRTGDSMDLWLEYDPVEILAPEIVEKLRAGESDSGRTPDDIIYATRLVPDSGYVFTLNYQDGSFYGPWIVPQSIGLLSLGALLLLFLTYYYMVVRPLSMQLSALELVAQGVVGGNFTVRVPVDSVEPDSVASRFNDMASQIETLISENDSILEDHREMLRAVAHEFRGPLARIRFALDMTEDAGGGHDSHDLFCKMGNDLDELNLLVGEVLSYARLQPGAPSFTFASVDLKKLIDDAMSEGRLNYPDIRIEECAQGKTTAATEVDSFYIQRAILNLLNNAARHAKSTVRLTWIVDDLNCTVHVDDDGDGVPAHWQGRIFEPFVRVDPSRSRQSGGVGLGLSIARRIVENHHGQIAVGSAPELGGARFTIIWPLVRAPETNSVTRDFSTG